MKTIRDYYNQAILQNETLLAELINLIIKEKKLMNMDDDMELFRQKFLNPPAHLKEAWNKRYREGLEEMRKK